ncbi:MAG: proline--tRNA ligase, partial [bacterium]
FGGFALSHWCGSTKCENKINEDLSVSIRCIPLSQEKSDKGKCILCGKQSNRRVVFARAY